jgi:two-component system chemotaxis response regulator CheB
LFRSAAVCCSTRVIGVLLSGMLNDGTSGLLAIKRCGGLAIVQDPQDAAFPDMPRNALAHVAVDHVVPLAELAPLLSELATSPRPPPLATIPEEIRIEALIAAQELTAMPDQHPLGPLSPLACPDCHGSMVEIREGDLLRFRCHTGHAFTLETLRLAQGEAWEQTLYAAMRAQQEQAMLARRLAAEAEANGRPRLAGDFARRERDYEEGAEVIRQLLAQGNGIAVQPDP